MASKKKSKAKESDFSSPLYGLREMMAKYNEIAKSVPVVSDDMSDKEVKRRMRGHAMWDDPPEGWTERDLLLWSRGYLSRERSLCGNVGSQLRAEIYLVQAILDGKFEYVDGEWVETQKAA